VIENGMAEMIDPKADTNKYLALHKTAPVGTIMQVKNAMNGQVVYVRVIGKLPETGTNNNVVVRISKKAYQKLGAVDQKFRVEVSYMP
jgi:rare lipoprotein A (peptidoglycan hydrolase)